MNKELVLKYKEQFDHLLLGGTCFALNSIGKWDNIRLEYFECSISEGPVIIWDEYVEFRKALAEGKMVQYVCADTSDGPIYKKIDAIDALTHRPDRMRIKPDESDEPEIKVGDWVINPFYKGNDRPFKFEEDDKNNSKTWILYTHKWQPRPNEWCWFYDAQEHPKLGKFNKIGTNKRFIDKITKNSFTHCEPFIGELPSTLKE